MFAAAAFDVAVAFALLAVLPFPTAMPLDQWWMVGLFFIVTYGQFAFSHTKTGHLRVSNEELNELTLMVAIFFIAPMWILVAKATAIGLVMFGRRIQTPAKVSVNVAYISAKTAVVLLVANRLVPDTPLEVNSAVVLTIVVWLVNAASASFFIAPLSLARWGRLRFSYVAGVNAGFWLHGFLFASGLLVAIAIEAAPVLLIPLAAIVLIALSFAEADLRAGALDEGVDRLSKFSADIQGAKEPLEIVDHLLVAVDWLSIVSYAVVTPSGSQLGRDLARGSGNYRDMARSARGMRWYGRIDTGIQPDHLTDLDQIAPLVSSPPFASPFGAGTLGAWLVEAETDSYLLVHSLLPADLLSDQWTFIGHLTELSRLSIQSARHERELLDRAERERRRARTDELTGLPNRLGLLEWLDERLDLLNASTLAVAVIHMTGHQRLIDVLGQEHGDEVTVEFGQRLASLRDVEIVARFGQDKFVICFEGDARRAVEVAAQATAGPSEGTFGQGSTRVATSGAAIAYPGQSITSTELIARADMALSSYGSANRPVVFGDHEAEWERRRVAIFLRMDNAIRQHVITPAFQPQIDLRSGELIGAEVLARWSDPELGVVSPAEFIEIAEESQLVEPLTICMLEQALAARASWPVAASDMALSVNLSARSLTDGVFLRQLVEAVTEADGEPDSLTLELTESTLVNDGETLRSLANLHELGARLSIDDFGTGYSSLSYLDRLPVHEVKIDRSMVAPLSDVVGPSLVLRRMIELCSDLGYAVVAEGIETQTQADIMHRLRCPIGQGYLFGRPMSSEAMTQWIRDYDPSRFAAMIG